ncbi:hypothetical protein PsYK624_159480 [Phanerochaete sordida]|uniref:Uncharacterized protein n=1 Tax=Phanerochaete sordida TaxID=48140 RepID=A0A9P3GQ33_9APHY|nr:hypothetical protein PsYK624_159480 [Phanerochaete sordida]
MTTITALPAASTPAKRNRQPAANSFNIAYLSPIFALAGAIAGALFAWAILRLCRRRTGLWEPKLKAGPAYVPTAARPDSTPGDAVSQTSEARSSDAFLDPGRAPQPSRASSKTSSHWLVRAFSAHHRSPATADAERGSPCAAEDDPFLAPPSVPRGVSPGLTPERRFELMRTPDVLSEDEELDAAPWDTLRHKSIRRGILARLHDSPSVRAQHRRGHARHDSDVTLEQARLAAQGAHSPARGRPLVRTDSGATTASTPRSSGPGFRLVEEDPAERRTSILGVDVALPWRTSRASSRAGTRDTLTALPQRASSADRRARSPAKSRIVEMLGTPGTPSRTRHPVSSPLAAASPPPLPRVDSRVLPSSPPRIASPPLEAQLFFAPLGAFDGPPTLEVTAPSSSSSSSRSPERHHTQLARTPKHLARKAPLRQEPGARFVSPPPALGERALDRVDQILAVSWSARDLRGEERVKSPTMFGAVG